MTTQRSILRRPDHHLPLHRLRWLRSATDRPRAALRHIRVTGQLGHFDDPDDARRTGARF
jgi:hypothetical protein